MQVNMALLGLTKPKMDSNIKKVNYLELSERKSVLANKFWQMAGDNVTGNGSREIILIF